MAWLLLFGIIIAAVATFVSFPLVLSALMYSKFILGGVILVILWRLGVFDRF